MSNNAKSAIRDKYLVLRKRLSDIKITKDSLLIEKNLSLLPEYNASKDILFYISANSEVKTHELIKKALLLNIDVYVPMITDSPLISKLYDLDDLENYKNGFLHVKKDLIEKRPLSDIHTIIVPGIVFDKRGHRIGYGGGYYDKLLHKSNILKIGLAYSFQVVEKVPNESHDIPVDILVTEKEIIRCKNDN